ncbi:unnamed protein product [Nesidiocoris tenuis]|uniref:DUF5641 domain-containing protein n=1 Tax=Nesidiocoris tenuis TaxID=355587 RepID=A0A6H5HL10_9HEMI|nr:unnamed protein product [Nesidiocoris tenuis]
MATLLARVEAVLNSRPLCPLSSTDPHAAPSCLTPGHFLVGGPLIGPPEYNLLGTKDNLLDRWQAVQRASQEFWRSWHKDYLHTLIQRSKWNQHREAPSVGEPVFVYGVQSRPLEWPLGIVEKLLPGADGIPRAADVRTATGSYRRPVAALVPLPQENPSYQELFRGGKNEPDAVPPPTTRALGRKLAGAPQLGESIFRSTMCIHSVHT